MNLTNRLPCSDMASFGSPDKECGVFEPELICYFGREKLRSFFRIAATVTSSYLSHSLSAGATNSPVSGRNGTTAALSGPNRNTLC